ncbi:MAG: class I SAM-dependent methyltransferase [Gaiella sp.]
MADESHPSDQAENTYQWDLENTIGYANAMGRYRTELERAFVYSRVRGERLRILDVGGGSGRFAIPLAERGHSVTVVDVSESAIALLDSRGAKGVTAHCGDYMAYDLDGGYDVALGIESIQSFNHVPLAEVFRKVHGHLRPGGRFVFTQLNGQSIRYKLHRMRAREVWDEFSVRGPAGYAQDLRAAGFGAVSMEGFVWMPFSVLSDSRWVSTFAAAERALRLGRWLGQSPWLMIDAERPADS